MLDVIIVGGGPAGMSAALVLGRCRRRVLICDTGEPRNRWAREMHGYLTRDCTPPADFLQIARRELEPYGVQVRGIRVKDVEVGLEHFTVSLDGGERLESRMVLLATGVRDHIPDVPGVLECYGTSVHHCPYCDGWENREKTIAVLGKGTPAAGLALSLRTWTDRIVICSNGRARIGREQRQQLREQGIDIHEAAVVRLDHEEGRARGLVLAQGGTIACDAVFFSSGQSPQCDFAERLGCELTSKGVVKTDHLGKTRVPGLYVVGDASRDVQFVIVAAAEGAKAAVAINKALQASAGHAVRK